jgi:hypothetical protein
MTKLFVQDVHRGVSATVIPSKEGGGHDLYQVLTVDTTLKELIEKAIFETPPEGLMRHFSGGKQITDSGWRYQRVGRLVKPGESDFLKALGEYLKKYDLHAHPVEPSTDLI